MKSTTLRTRNDLPEKTRGEMIKLLNQHLADILDLGLQVKQAHWNVKGHHFIGLHELFDKVAEELEEYTDSIAERAVQLGGNALGTIQAVSKSSRLPAYPLDLVSGDTHASKVADALATFGASVRKAIDEANNSGDLDSANLFTEVSRGEDKLLWMFEAYLQPSD